MAAPIDDCPLLNNPSCGSPAPHDACVPAIEDEQKPELARDRPSQHVLLGVGLRLP